MNKKIQELAHQAAQNTNANLMIQDHKFVTEFANLLIEECITVLDKKDPDFNDFSKRILKQYFKS